MEQLYKILIIGMILITLTKIHTIENFYNSINLKTNQVDEQPVTLSNMNDLNNLELIQKNQGIIFDICMKEFEKNNDARNVMLLDEKDIYPLQYLKDKIDEIEVNLNKKLEAEKNELCKTFKTDYCVDDSMEFNQNPELYKIPVEEFNTKMDLCYSTCYKYDVQEIRHLRKLLYNTLFDILLRYDVLQKLDGEITQPQNKKRYEYLINYNRDDVIDIDLYLAIFSKNADKHLNFVKELHRFMRIVVLNTEKIDINNVVYNDKKKAIQHNFTIQKYKDPTKIYITEEE